MKTFLNKLMKGESLSFFEIKEIVRSIANNEVSDAQIGAFLVAITAKGVDRDEFFAFAANMREYAHRVKTDKYIVDSCGTGADLSKTINVSTASAIVANACGVNVLKQTNSAITSACGSTDLLNALNIPVSRTPEAALEVFERNNISFVHSPYFNEFAKVNNPIRQQIGIKTIFNYLGPLINPCFPDAQLLGVSSLEMCEKMAYALQKLKCDRALVVNGIDPNIDEISICSQTKVYELKNGEVTDYILTPEQFGFNRADISELEGGTPLESAKMIEEIFADKLHGARADIIALNAGAMIYLSGIRSSIGEGVEMAQVALKDGSALVRLKGLCEDAELFKTV